VYGVSLDQGPRTKLLERAREAYDRRAWREAHADFATADSRSPMAPDDLELYARTDTGPTRWSRSAEGHVRTVERLGPGSHRPGRRGPAAVETRMEGLAGARGTAYAYEHDLV
jgi:hypothetical protein